jgi:hypothetical protein
VATNHQWRKPLSAKLPKLSSLAFTCLSLLWSAPSEAQQQPPSANAPTVNVTIPPDTTLGQPADGSAGESATELAKKLQNPIGHLYNVPFQNNTNFNVGPHSGTQDILNIQPVIPIHVNQDWNVITRTILPLVWSPSFQPGQSFPFGTGPMTFSAFLSPRNPVDGWFSFGGTQGPNGTRYGLFTINPFLNYDFGDDGEAAIFGLETAAIGAGVLR